MLNLKEEADNVTLTTNLPECSTDISVDNEFTRDLNQTKTKTQKIPKLNCRGGHFWQTILNKTAQYEEVTIKKTEGDATKSLRNLSAPQLSRGWSVGGCKELNIEPNGEETAKEVLNQEVSEERKLRFNFENEVVRGTKYEGVRNTEYERLREPEKDLCSFNKAFDKSSIRIR